MHRRKRFCVYPPDYVPGRGFKVVLTVKAAKRQCKTYGDGATVMPCIHFHDRKRAPWSSSVTQPLWQYTSAPAAEGLE